MSTLSNSNTMSTQTALKRATEMETSKARTITVRLPVKVYYETEVSYTDFKEMWMEEKEEDETDADYELRCARTWRWMVKKTKGEVELSEIDEEECHDNVDPLECYGTAEDEWRDKVDEWSETVRKAIAKEKATPETCEVCADVIEGKVYGCNADCAVAVCEPCWNKCLAEREAEAKAK